MELTEMMKMKTPEVIYLFDCDESVAWADTDESEDSNGEMYIKHEKYAQLKAHCFDLEAGLAHSLCKTSSTGTHRIDKMGAVLAKKEALKILERTPAQSLNKIKADVLREFSHKLGSQLVISVSEIHREIERLTNEY